MGQNRSQASKKAVPPKLCKAHSSQTGERCKRYAIVGGDVCPTHGGSAPQVREAARKRILRLVDDALTGMAALAGIGGSGLGAESEAVRQRALADLLDRAGLKATDKLEVTQESVTNEALDEAIARALEDRSSS
jgi:hypothetical protein